MAGGGARKGKGEVEAYIVRSLLLLDPNGGTDGPRWLQTRSHCAQHTKRGILALHFALCNAANVLSKNAGGGHSLFYYATVETSRLHMFFW